jgi:parvulin-like peptidyl-prolyl isomerase
MRPDMQAKLIDEISLLQTNIEMQKRVIKRNLGKAKSAEEAQQHLKELNTRLGVLEGNLKKLREQESAAATIETASGVT